MQIPSFHASLHGHEMIVQDVVRSLSSGMQHSLSAAQRKIALKVRPGTKAIDLTQFLGIYI